MRPELKVLRDRVIIEAELAEREGRYGFQSLLVDPGVLAYIGSRSAPPAVANCLRSAFDQIQRKRLRMWPTERAGEFVAYACDHIIAASVTSDGETVVIVRVRHAPDAEELL